MWQLILLLTVLIVSLIFYQNFSTVGAFTEGLDNREDHKAEPKTVAKPAQHAAATQPTQHAAAAKPAQHAAAAQPVQHAAAAQPAQHATAAQPVQHAAATQPVQHAAARQPVQHAAAAQPAQHAAAAKGDSKPAERPHPAQMEKKPEPKEHVDAAKQPTRAAVAGTAALGAGAAVGTAAATSGTAISTSHMNKYDSNAIYSPPPPWMNKNADTQGSAYVSNTGTSSKGHAELPPIQQNTFNQTYSQSICPQSTIENFMASLTVFKNAVDTFVLCLERTNNPHYHNLIQKLKIFRLP